jgi:hypothetical protein
MGMFTSIRHPVGGREIQIKIGDDFCEWYNVGDKIKWAPSRWNVGYHPDDIYQGICYPDQDAFVVIRDLVVVHVEDVESDTSDNDEELTMRDLQLRRLEKEYPIKSLHESLWKSEWIEENLESKRKAHEEFEAYRKSLSGKSKDEILGALFAYPIARNLDYAGLAGRALKVEPLPTGALKEENE